MSQQTQKLRLNALIALVVGSMIGGGIFSLPQNIAERAAGAAVLIGWAITAVGMLALAFVFQTLANRKPELDSGVYAYAKAGFGDYMGETHVIAKPGLGVGINTTVQIGFSISESLEHKGKCQHADCGDCPAD